MRIGAGMKFLEGKKSIIASVVLVAVASAAVLLAGGIWLSRLSNDGGSTAEVIASSEKMSVVSPSLVEEKTVVPEASSLVIALNESSAQDVHEEPLAVQRDNELKLNGGVSTQDLRTVASNGANYGMRAGTYKNDSYR